MKILVKKRSELFAKHYFQGFISLGIARKANIDWANNTFYFDREKAELDPSLKQLIPYVVVFKQDNILVYQRVSSSSYKEERLRNLYSIGVGGHVEHPESIEQAMIRELEEEFGLSVKKQDLKLVGFINDDSNSVGSVHFGVVYKLDLKSNVNVKPEPREVHNHVFVSRLELKSMLENNHFETWSKILVPVIVYSKLF